ncbi:MAG: ABC transporter permease subunit [Alphaproteobacteria bacterium]
MQDYGIHYKSPLWVKLIYLVLAVFLFVFVSFIGYIAISLTLWLIHIADMNWQPVQYALEKSFQLGRNYGWAIVKIIGLVPCFALLFFGLKKVKLMDNKRAALIFNLLLMFGFLIALILFFRFLGQIVPYVNRTISLAFFGVVIGFFIGLIIVAFRFSPFKILRSIGYMWIYVFRGTPFILQAYFIWNLSSLLLVAGFAAFLAKVSFYTYLPFDALMSYFHNIFGSNAEVTTAMMHNPQALENFTNQFIRYWNQPYWWVLLALAMNSSAYGSEIIRGGLLSVDNKQLEAAKAYGMSKRQVFLRVRLKQAIAQALPTYSNEVILVLKATVVASAALSLIDFWDGYQKAASRYATVFGPLIAIGIFYFLFNFGLARLFRKLEKRANPWIYKNQSG